MTETTQGNARHCEIQDEFLIRVLHLSDFHVGKDAHGQSVLFDHLLDHIQDQIHLNLSPDMVLITGDIAQSGKPKQYKEFKDAFLTPLKKKLHHVPLYIVPGNHDVDREKAKAAHGYDLLKKCPNFFDPTKKGLSDRKTLHPRFKAYVDGLGSIAPTSWITSEKGYFTTIQMIAGFKLGLLLLNTAWLSGGDCERFKLRLGNNMVEHGLNQLRDADLVLTLGHHPLTWLSEVDSPKIEALFGKRRVIYLSGHIHKGQGRVMEGSGESFLALGAGAGFQAREDNAWVNGFQWYELDLRAGKAYVKPLVWNPDHQEWSLDTNPFPNKRKVEKSDFWFFEIKKCRLPLKENIFRTAGPLPPGCKSYIERDCDVELKRSLKTNKLISIIGSPQVGKSSLLNQLNETRFELNEWKDFYLNFEELSTYNVHHFMNEFFERIGESFGNDIKTWGKLRKGLSKCKTIFRLDEFCFMAPEVAMEFIPKIFWLATSLDTVRFVTCSPVTIGAYMRDLDVKILSNPKYANCWHQIELKYFNENEVNALMNTLPDEVCESIDGLKEYLKKVSEFKQQALQCLCSNLYRAYCNGKKRNELKEIILNPGSYR